MPVPHKLRRLIAFALAGLSAAAAAPSRRSSRSTATISPIRSSSCNGGEFIAYATNDGINLPMLVSRDLVNWSQVKDPATGEARRRHAGARAVGRGRPNLGARGDEGRRQVAALLHRPSRQAEGPVPRSRGRRPAPRGRSATSRPSRWCANRPGRHDRRQPVPRFRRQALSLLQERRERGRQDHLHLGAAAQRDGLKVVGAAGAADQGRRQVGMAAGRSAGDGAFARRPSDCSTRRRSSAGTPRSGCRATRPAMRPAPGRSARARTRRRTRSCTASTSARPAASAVPAIPPSSRSARARFMAFHAWAATSGCRKAEDERYLYIAPLFWKDGKPQLGVSLRPVAPGDRG